MSKLDKVECKCGLTFNSLREWERHYTASEPTLSVSGISSYYIRKKEYAKTHKHKKIINRSS